MNTDLIINFITYCIPVIEVIISIILFIREFKKDSSPTDNTHSQISNIENKFNNNFNNNNFNNNRDININQTIITDPSQDEKDQKELQDKNSIFHYKILLYFNFIILVSIIALTFYSTITQQIDSFRNLQLENIFSNILNDALPKIAQKSTFLIILSIITLIIKNTFYSFINKQYIKKTVWYSFSLLLYIIMDTHSVSILSQQIDNWLQMTTSLYIFLYLLLVFSYIFTLSILTMRTFNLYRNGNKNHEDRTMTILQNLGTILLPTILILANFLFNH